MARYFCIIALLSLPQARAAVLWDNGEYDHRSGIMSVRSEGYWETWAVDDAALPACILHVVSVDNMFEINSVQYVTGVDLIILRQEDDRPATEVASFRDLPCECTFVEQILYQFELDRLSTGNLNVRLPAGKYYFGLRPVSGNYFSYLVTTGWGEIHGTTPGFFKSEYFGYPDWTPVGDIMPIGPTDFSFRLEGDLIGDLNCDGAVDGADIEPFFQALVWPDQYIAQHPDCDLNLADVNGDGAVDGADIDPFFALLGG